MRPEFMESRDTPEMIYRLRHNKLKPRAYGISPGTRPLVDAGWTVFFEPTDEGLRAIPKVQGEPDPTTTPFLRGLYVSRSFEILFMEHLDLRHDAPRKLAYTTDPTP